MKYCCSPAENRHHIYFFCSLALQKCRPPSGNAGEARAIQVQPLSERTGLAKPGGLGAPLSSSKAEPPAREVRGEMVRGSLCSFFFFLKITKNSNGSLRRPSRGVLKSALQMKNYSSRFHLLLHLEEIQMEVDIRKYDMYNQTMSPDQINRTLLTLRVSRGDGLLMPVT